MAGWSDIISICFADLFMPTQSLSSARMMQLLASMNTVREVDVDSYEPNSYAKAMTKPIFGESVKSM
jgi:hypothetical protein